jgi:hypothetical protein
MAGVLQGFFDESGIAPRDTYCIVAGMVGTGRNWQTFEAAWLKASGGVNFHGRRFFVRDPKGQRVSPYSGWQDARARAYLSGLVDVILSHSHGLRIVGSAVHVPSFRARTTAERHALTGAGFKATERDGERRWKLIFSGAPATPYFLGFSDCVTSAAHCAKNADTKVDFFFERQDAFKKHALKSYDLAREKAVPELRARLGEISFVSKDSVGGLQAGDMLAHTSFKRTKTAVGVSEELDFVTGSLLPMTRQRIRHWNAESIERFLAAMFPEDLRRQRLKGQDQ